MPIHTTYSQARESLASLMDRVIDDSETVIISRRGKPDVALIDAAELSSMQETAYLMRSPANARRLLEALFESLNGSGKVMTIEELKKEVGLLEPQTPHSLIPPKKGSKPRTNPPKDLELAR